MKLFISADIEGTAGIDSWDETSLGEKKYDWFASQMTAEVAAACRAAQKNGYDVTVKDAHDSARNIDPSGLPENAELLRGWVGDLYCMMSGIDREPHDFAAFTGYHSDAMSDGNPLSHTMHRSVQKVRINGEYASEFTINAYMAGHLGIPVIFLSGDAALCESAKKFIPGIHTVASKTGIGGGVISKHPSVVCHEIEREFDAAVKFASTPEGKRACTVKMPERFKLEVEYKEWGTAYKYSFYPGAHLADTKTVVFEADDYIDVMRFMHFCL